MPAASDPDRPGSGPAASRPQVRLPHTWRPFGARIAATVAGIALLVVCGMAWLAFPPEVRAQFTVLQRLTIAFFAGIGFVLWLALVRSRVVARADRLEVVNGFRTHTYEWAEVVAVHLLRGAPWATLDLADGTTVSALAIQGSDGQRAHRAVRELRSLLT